MELLTIVPIIAAVTTIGLTLYTLYRKFDTSWKSLQEKVVNLEKSLQVNQRVTIKNDIMVPYGMRLIKIESNSEVEILSSNSETGMVKIRAMDGLLPTATHIDNINVDTD